jgi:hypothetical protein
MRGPRSLLSRIDVLCVVGAIVFVPRIAAGQIRPAAGTPQRAGAPPVKLPVVTVQADSSLPPLFDPDGFEARRLNATGGIFIRADEIERRHPIETEQILRGLPGIDIDHDGVVWLQRGMLSLRDALLSPKKSKNEINTCLGAQVLIDRAEMPQPFNVNTVSPTTIRAIEIYKGPATTPPTLRAPKSVCGTVAIWTK